jgi:hypothetical protein
MGFVQAVANFYKRYSETVVGVSDFLKDDLPANAPSMGKFAQEVGRRACRQYARNRANYGVIAYDPVWSDSCNPYLDSIDEGATANGNYGPPFPGGQCSNLFYTVTVQGPNRCPGGNSFSVVVPGPVSGLIQVGNPGYLGGCAGGPGQSVRNNVVAGGQTWPVNPSNLHPDDAPKWRITSVTVFGSGTDNCGNLPSQYNPPTYPPNLPPIPPPSNPGPGFGNDWDVEINPDGTFNICIDGECSDPLPPGPGDRPPGDPSEEPGEEDGDPNENNPNDPTGDITGCASEGQILTGIKIEITQVPVNENPGSGGFYRNVCWVWMGPSQDQLDLVTDGRFLESGQFVIPDSNNCRCYRVRPSPLWGLSVQAYSRPEKED